MAAFEGNARFSVRRLLGTGGRLGTVYEAHDADTGQVVALKTINFAPRSRRGYRLKNEFRSLADIGHPNLVSLFELFIEEDRCFFTHGTWLMSEDFVTYTTKTRGVGQPYRQYGNSDSGPNSEGCRIVRFPRPIRKIRNLR